MLSFDNRNISKAVTKYADLNLKLHNNKRMIMLYSLFQTMLPAVAVSTWTTTEPTTRPGIVALAH